MKAIYESELTILPSMCDAEGKLGVPDAFGLFMDMAAAHAEHLGTGFKDMMPRGLFWLTVRTKLRFHRRPELIETVRAITWPETPERSRCNRDYILKKGDETLIEGKTEWMVMNTRTGRLWPADSVFPADLEVSEERVLPEPLSRLSDDLQDAEELGTYTVRSTDIDLGGHMNNAAYVHAIAGMFSSADWKALDIREMEVAFRTPCFEGEVLRVQKQPTPEGLAIRLSREGKTVLLARIS